MSAHKALSQAKLRRSIERVAHLTSAFDLLAEHIIITDDDAHILYANTAAERATGFTLSEMLGKNPADLWGGNMTKDFYRQMWRKIKKEKQPFVGEVCNVQKNGEKTWQELRISPILDRRNKVDVFIGIEGIITNRKHRERIKEDLASVVSHEALSPLTIIRWNLEWLQTRKKLPLPVRRRLKEISTQSRRTIDIFHDLALLSRLGYPENTIIDLGAEIQHILSQAKIQFRCTEISTAYKVRSIPSLTREFFSAFISAIEQNSKSGAKGECRLQRRGKNLSIIFALPAKFLKKPETNIHIPSLIARYLQWGTIQTRRSKQSMQWRILTPLT